ncbi:MAG TPA: prolyl oligopeptidase family serine peptidase [Terriglobales bacterium]
MTALLLSGSLYLAQNDAASFAAELFRYEIHPKIVYHVANNYEAKLDVYEPAAASQPTPVVIVIHGGGWIAGTKEDRVLEMMPYLQMGFAAVNVEYRMAQVSLAPAAVAWIGSQPNADEIAKLVSPINYVNSNLPPIITIHGDKDTLVPHAQSVRLHKALDAAGVTNELYTVPGAGHGGFTYEQNQKAWAEVRAFLKKNVKGLTDTTSTK